MNEQAISIRPEGEDSSILRWNTCARVLQRHPDLVPESEDQMDMIWVYAGPMPERIVIAPGFVREPSA